MVQQKARRAGPPPRGRLARRGMARLRRPSACLATQLLLLLHFIPTVSRKAIADDPWMYYPQRPLGVGWMNHTDHHRLGQLNRPASIIAVADNELVIADCFNNRIHIFSLQLQGDEVKPKRYTVLGGYGAGPGQLLRPSGLALGGKHIYVSDSHNHRIQKLTYPDFIAKEAAGSYGTGVGQLRFPGALAIADNRSRALGWRVWLGRLLEPAGGDGQSMHLPLSRPV